MAAAAVLLEEELQNSMATSEEDAEYEADDLADLVAENEDAVAANHQLQNGIMADNEDEDEDLASENAAISGEDAEDEEMAESAQNNVEEDSQEDEDEEDEDGEGVGAVKIQPGLLDDDEDALSGTDDDDEDGSVASGEEDDESKDSDAEVEVEWKSTAEEEEEEPANPNRCMYVGPNDGNQIYHSLTLLDSVTRTRTVTPARSLRHTCRVLFVVITVGKSLPFIMDHTN